MSGQDHSRITAEVPAEVMSTLQNAAALASVTVGEFIVQAGLAMAGLQLTNGDHFRRLDLEDAELLAHLLENPPEPNEALKRAFTRLAKDYDGVPVLTEPTQASRILAYYTLNIRGLISSGTLPPSLSQLPATVPALTIGRLAVDATVLNAGHGAAMLAHAMKRAKVLLGAKRK
jgi:uncharacterized protein (DUF1778 family)